MNYNERKGKASVFLHTHTDMGSPKDAILTIDEYLDVAKEMGAYAIAITDHGTLYAIQETYSKIKKNKLPIKLITGIEFYLCDTVEDAMTKKHIRLHLVAYAKDFKGYEVLCRLVTESNKRQIVNRGGLVFPTISKKLLEKYIGKGSEGHGHVLLTSACIQGVLTGLAITNENNINEYELYKKYLNDIKESKDKILMTRKDLENLSKAEEVTKENQKKYISLSKKNTKKLEGEELEKALLDKKNAEEELTKIETVLKQAKAMAKQKENFIKGIYENYLKIFNDNKYKFIEEDKLLDTISADLTKKIAELEKDVFDIKDIEAHFEKEMLYYKNLSGNNFLVEVQYHGMPEEKKYMFSLAKLAEKNNIPIVAANDAHMKKKEDYMVKAFVNSLRFNKWLNDPSESEKEVYLKDDYELFSALSECITEKYATKAMDNRDIVASLCNVEYEKIPHYPKFE